MRITFSGDFLSRLAVVLLLTLLLLGFVRAQATRRRPNHDRIRTPAGAAWDRLADGN